MCRIHFAGSDNLVPFNEILWAQKAQNRLESFHTLKGKEPSSGFTLLLDSGGFVARTKGVPINLDNYISYINRHKIQFAFNLDTNDLAETLANQARLIKETECYIIPIYHLSDYIQNRELLDDFIKDFPYISVGGVAGENSAVSMQEEFYRYVFSKTMDKTKVHGLGITAQPMLERYPWFSVDSTSWLAVGRFGNTRTTDDEIIAKFNAKNNHYTINIKAEVEWWLDLELYITDLWAKRGVIWN